MSFLPSHRSPSFDSCEEKLLEDNVCNQKSNRKEEKKGLHARVILLLCAHIIIATIYMTILYFWLKNKSRASLIYSPAQSALKFEKRFFYAELNDTNPYKGPPSPELDAAWNDLLAPTAIRVSEETMKRINRTSIRIKDGSGYFVTLDVYHQLHCLKYLRHYVHPEYYTINEPNIAEHVDHCLDTLRQYIMCNADVALNTYTWKPNYARPWPVFTTEHECVNWEALHSWALGHTFDGFNPELIQHP
ncbi:hypothetical protein GQ43DRAFT_406962 [Delitschia confertaspora ATCC 74209]|uniref:Tat pathway signal sequence n=1 Tax=Delitschia confertaspora ATCC 74209 TaxID=1513339 RepID=A0A9P4JV58_9PLEO|nr:hypothetical protein GQ43DRAFT_406962 [Delitschia confertaspora ATCC 74209]